MAPSKRYQEVIQLGKRIISEFTREEQTDITLTWMANYIAELMDKAQNEKDVAKKRRLERECSTFILDLWSKRAFFRGNAKPLMKLDNTIRVLQSLDNDSYDEYQPWKLYGDYQSDSHWATYMGKMSGSFKHIFALCFGAEGTREEMLNETEWLKYSDFLSEEEKLFLQLIEKYLTKNDQYLNILYESESNKQKSVTKPTKRNQIIAKLYELHKKQAKYLDELKLKIEQDVGNPDSNEF